MTLYHNPGAGPDELALETENYRMYGDGREEVTFSETEWAIMATDPAFGYIRRCGHPTTIVNGELIDDDCLRCEDLMSAAAYGEGS